MLNIGTLSAWITVDDVELPQYGMQYSPDGKQVTCWIASEMDKKFSVCWNDSHRLFSMLGRVSVDGLRCSGKFLNPGSKQVLVKINSVDTSPTTERPLMFSRLELTDDDSYLDTPISPALGDIRLEIAEVNVARTTRSTKKKAVSLKETDKIHERAKKGSGHRVKFGEEVACREISYRKSTIIRTLGTFIFKYRPIDVLQANGIVPMENYRSATVVSDETLDLTLDDDSNTDKKPDTAEKIRRLEEELRNLKGSGESTRKTKGVKPEVKAEPGNLFHFGEVIDLT